MLAKDTKIKTRRIKNYVCTSSTAKCFESNSFQLHQPNIQELGVKRRCSSALPLQEQIIFENMRIF